MHSEKLDEAGKAGLHDFVKRELQALIQKAGKVGFEAGETFDMIKRVTDANVGGNAKTADSGSARQEIRKEIKDALRK